MKNHFIITVSLLLTIQFAYAQGNLELKETFYSAEDYFFYEEYAEAIAEYEILRKEFPDNANILYKLGVCYFFLKDDLNKAITYLIKASANINPAYQDGYFKEEGAPPDVYYYLGNAYHIIDSLELAEQYYRKFKNSLDPYDIAGVDFAKQLIKTVNNAKELTQTPINFSSTDLANQPYEYSEKDYCIISGDNSTIVYFYIKNRMSQIFFSKKNHSSANKPEIISNISNTELPIYASSLSFNGNDLYLSKSENGNRDIFVCSFINNSWSDLVRLNKNINTRSDETHAFITKDGAALYFTSNRKKGTGGLDIYISYKDVKGEWDKPVLLGNSINTEFNEETPFLSPDEQTLYFSSEGHNSMGGYDIFYSNLDSKGKWTKPINLGYPINNGDNNLYYFPGKSNNEGYYSISVDGSLNKKKIVEINFAPEEIALSSPSLDDIKTDEIISKVKTTEKEIKNVVSDSTIILKNNSSIKQPEINALKQVTLNGRIILQDEKYNFTKISIEVKNEKGIRVENKSIKNSDGKFSISLNPGIYSIKVSADGYGTITQSVSIPSTYQPKEISFETELIPDKIIQGDYLAIKNIFFNFDSYRLTYDAIVELERIANYMLRNSSVKAEVTGHSDALGYETYNYELSRKRANTIYNYLINKGINKNRLIIKYKGENQQLAINNNPDGSDNPVGRRYNRRVEIILKNVDRNIEIDDNLFIPEYLRIKENELYTILVFVGSKIPDTTEIKNMASNKQKIIKYDIKQTKIITIGSTESKGSLAPLLNKLIDGGYTEAKIINIHEINNIVRPLAKTASTFDYPVYTIQLLCVKKPVDLTYFYGLKPIKISKSNDGYYRYTYKEFYNYNEAQKTLNNLKRCCHKDAFIQKIEDVPNYDEE